MTVAIIGLGLIGGSFAKAVKARTSHRVLGFDASADVLEAALTCGAIDAAVSDSGLSGADFTLVALYPSDAVEFLKAHSGSLKPGSTVVDLCGVKRFVCEHVLPLFRESAVTFIGGHPMAGRECSGFENARTKMFDGASMILTPDESTPRDKLEAAAEFFRAVGFGHIEIATAYHHDEMIAYTSQLAHIVSSAYIKSPVARGYMGFSAGSFADLTRVARLNETMWTELFLHNGDFLSEQLGIIIDNLANFREAISSKDGGKLRDMLREGREIKERLDPL